jgi:hypothetical protein
MLLKSRYLGVLFLGLALSVQARAESYEEAYFTIEGPIVVNAPSSEKGLSYSQLDTNAIDWAELIKVGKDVWDVIIANKAVVNVKTDNVSVLPASAKTWNQMSGWKGFNTQSVHVQYKNRLGMTIVDFEYRLQYAFGGNVNGNGRYLANVTIVPQTLWVSWGFNFNAAVKTGQVLNVGTTTGNPVAGVQLDLGWTISSPINQIQESEVYFLTGDGKVNSSAYR